MNNDDLLFDGTSRLMVEWSSAGDPSDWSEITTEMEIENSSLDIYLDQLGDA